MGQGIMFLPLESFPDALLDAGVERLDIFDGTVGIDQPDTSPAKYVGVRLHSACLIVSASLPDTLEIFRRGGSDQIL
jgi:hypothetical protein